MPNPNTDTAAGDVLPLMFPCLLWEPSLDILVLATAGGTGTVLHAGHSKVLQVGMIIPFAASRWSYGGEDWDFIIPPPGTKAILTNRPGTGSPRPGGLDTEIRVVQE